MTSLDRGDITNPPEIGAYVFGLFMEGGRFDRDRMQMAESLPRMLLSPMPAVWLKPVEMAGYKPVNVVSRVV